MEPTHEPLYLHVIQMKFSIIKDHGHTLFESLFFIRLSNMAMVQNFEVMLVEILNHGAKNFVILCIVISS